jgi:GntR family transcriptional regulator, transcriptional repressor for pyruvate dehydrogenase complex
MFTAVDQPRLVSARIADQIEARIADGTFAVGQRLPTEADLAAEFGVSRPSVREGLAALQFVGLVESRRGYGTVVVGATAGSTRPQHAEGSRATRRPLTSMAEVLDLFESRLLLEPAAMALAAMDPDHEAIEAADALVSGMDIAVDDPALHASTDIRVHRALLHVCRNEILRSSALELLDLVLDPMLVPARAHAWASHDRPQDWAKQHRAVLEAIQSGDEVRARRVSAAHLVSVVHSLAEVVKDQPGMPGRVERMLALAATTTSEPTPAQEALSSTLTLLDEVRKARFDDDS